MAGSGAMAGQQQPATRQTHRFLSISSLLFRAFKVSAIAAFACQTVIDRSPENIWCSLMAAASTLLTLHYLHSSVAFVTTPLSSLSLLGLCVTTQWTSLVAHTLSGNALIEGLRVSTVTFAALLTVQALAVGTHWLYRNIAGLQRLRENASWGVEQLGGFRPVRPAVIWPLAGLGALSMVIGGAETGNSGGKLVQALSFFAWLPAAIPVFHTNLGGGYCKLRQQVPLLVAYALLLMLIGVSRNNRQLMLIGPIQVVLIMLIFWLRDLRPVTPRFVTWLGVGVVLASVFIYGARDIATAMVLVREARSTLTPVQMVQETFAALGDRDKLVLYADQGRFDEEYAIYSEAYLDNPLLARFSETKFHDNMFDIARQFTSQEREAVIEANLEKVLALLPQPVLNRLSLDIDKDKNSFSMGDFYRSLIEGEQTLGGYATGSVWADFWVVFGYWAPVAAAALFLMLFVLIDSLSKVSGAYLALSPLAVCTTWSIFIYGLSGESLAVKAAYVLRSYPEKLLLYCIPVLFLGWLIPRLAGRDKSKDTSVEPLLPRSRAIVVPTDIK